MNTQRLVVFAVIVVLAAAPAFAQFPSSPVNETTQSFGQFQILVAPKFVPLFTGCPGFDSGTRILTSPTLYDPATVIGVSAATTEGTPGENAPGIPVGTPPTTIGDNILSPPAGFPSPAHGTREVHTQIRSLNLTGSGVTVSLGAGAISPGEVDSQSSSGHPANDFPARSFFDVYVQVVLPHCGSFPGPTTVYNRHNQPLKVQADNLAALPPVVVYMHDNSTTVPILFSTDNGKLWKRDEPLGCFVLAGHGVGVKENTPAERANFERHMKEHGRPAKACSLGMIMRPVRPEVLEKPKVR